jgi:predicted phage terminase large subunit-like protein
MTDLSMLDDRAMFAALLRRDPTFFLCHAMSVLGGEGPYVHGWHIDAILHELDLLREGLNRRLIITMPPRHLKSTTAAIAWIAWMLGHNPALRFITVSYGGDLAEKQGLDTLKILQDPMVRRAFPQLQLTRRSAVDIETTLGGGRLSTSLGGTLTGRGADYIIIDDPTKSVAATSLTVRESDKAWLFNTLMTRLNDPGQGRIILIMQRLHEDDLAGELQRRGGWKELRLPAIAEQDEKIAIGPDRYYQRRTGNALHPARISLGTLRDMRRDIGSYNFAAQFQQNPIPAKGNLVKAEWLASHDPSFDPHAVKGRIVQSWDSASKDGIDNDWSVCVTAHIQGREIRIIDVFRRRVQFPELLRHAKRLAREHRATTILIEEQSSGIQLIQALRADPSRGIPMPLAQKPESDKLARLSGVSAMIEEGVVSLPSEANWLATFKTELLGFPNARHDDQVDAFSQLLAWARTGFMLPKFVPVAPIVCFGRRPSPGGM